MLIVRSGTIVEAMDMVRWDASLGGRDLEAESVGIELATSCLVPVCCSGPDGGMRGGWGITRPVLVVYE